MTLILITTTKTGWCEPNDWRSGAPSTSPNEEQRGLLPTDQVRQPHCLDEVALLTLHWFISKPVDIITMVISKILLKELHLLKGQTERNLILLFKSVRKMDTQCPLLITTIYMDVLLAIWQLFSIHSSISTYGDHNSALDKVSRW